jgi:hypothetical protein
MQGLREAHLERAAIDRAAGVAGIDVFGALRVDLVTHRLLPDPLDTTITE